MNVKAFSIFILALLYLAVVLCENPFKSVVWDGQHNHFLVNYQLGDVNTELNCPDINQNRTFNIEGVPVNYSASNKTLTAVVDGVTYKVVFDFAKKKGTIIEPYSLTTKVMMGGGISVTAVVIIGALYYFLAAPAPVPSPIDAAKEKKAKLPKKEAKKGKLSKKRKASKGKDSKREKLPKK